MYIRFHEVILKNYSIKLFQSYCERNKLIDEESLERLFDWNHYTKKTKIHRT